MLTTIDDSVLAEINLRAVFGALPALVDVAPEAKQILGALTEPVTLTLRSPSSKVSYTFRTDAVEPGAAHGVKGPVLVFRSAKHVNAVVAGTSQPIPVAGPKGIRFLTHVFTPLTALLGEYLKPTPERLADSRFADASTLLTFEVVATAIAIVAAKDRSGRVSAEHMPDGTLDFEIGDAHRYRIAVKHHRVTRQRRPVGSPTAALRFRDLAIAGDILGGRVSSLSCVSDGRLAMRGMIPLVDNTNRLLDRVGAYLGA